MARRGRPPHPGILTPREEEVRLLLREGLTNDDIADRLGITTAGVKFHVSEIISKLHVTTRQEAAAWDGTPPSHRGILPWLRSNATSNAATGLPAAAGLVVLLITTTGLTFLTWAVVSTREGRDNQATLAPAWTVFDSPTARPSVMLFDLEHQQARRIDLGAPISLLQWVNNDDLLMGVDSEASDYRALRLDGTIVRSVMSQPTGRLTNWFVPRYDGLHVIFKGMNGDLLEVNALTGDSRQLDSVDLVISDAQVARDGSRYVYREWKEQWLGDDGRWHDDSLSRLYLSNGMSIADVYGADTVLELAPDAWSPDGTKILAVQSDLGNVCGPSCRGYVGQRVFRVYDLKQSYSYIWSSESTLEYDVEWAGPDRLYVERYDVEPGGSLAPLREYVDLATGERVSAPISSGISYPSFSPDGRHAVARIGDGGPVTCSEATCEAPEWDLGCGLIDASSGDVLARFEGTTVDIGAAFCATVSWTADGTKAIVSPGGN
jgi:DNA-binding CsgD family transcriptional regulator